MDDREFEKRKNQAMQKIRPMICKELDKVFDNLDLDELFEDEIIEALVDAGIDMPLDPDADAEGVDQAIGQVQKCIDEATYWWHTERIGPVWAVVSFDPENGLHGLECEFFSERPRTATAARLGGTNGESDAQG